MGLNPSDVGSRLQLIVPGQEQVTLYIRQPAPANDQFTAYTIFGARRRPESLHSGGFGETVAATTNVTWHLYRPSLNTAGVPQNTVPESYAYLVDSTGTKYIVHDNEAESLRTFVKLRTYQEV